jgi:hypothetical protein
MYLPRANLSAGMEGGFFFTPSQAKIEEAVLSESDSELSLERDSPNEDE